MNHGGARLEETVRTALHDAADHAVLAATPAVSDVHEHRTRPARHRARVLVAVAAAAVVAVVVAVVVIVRSGDDAVRVVAPAGQAREVPVSEIPRDQADVSVFMKVGSATTDEEIAGVRAQVEASPDVAQFAFLDNDASWREFSEIFACNPDLVHSVRPEDLPVEFRIVTPSDAPDAASQLADQLLTLPGVQSVHVRGTTTPDTKCEDTLSSSPNPTSTPPPPAP